MKKKILFFILITLTLFFKIDYKVSAEDTPIDISYNLNQWFINWREEEFGDEEIDICFIIDDSFSTKESDPNDIRGLVIKQFISHLKENDNFCVVQDYFATGKTPYDSTLPPSQWPYIKQTTDAIYKLGKNKNDAKNIIDSREKPGDKNFPYKSVLIAINELSSNLNEVKKEVILHIADGSFGYNDYKYKADQNGQYNFDVSIDPNLIDSLKEYGISMYTVGFTANNTEEEYIPIEIEGSLKKWLK